MLRYSKEGKSILDAANVTPSNAAPYCGNDRLRIKSPKMNNGQVLSKGGMSSCDCYKDIASLVRGSLCTLRCSYHSCSLEAQILPIDNLTIGRDGSKQQSAQKEKRKATV